MGPMHMPKTPKELEERFAAVIAAVEGLEPRRMFGYPAAFLGGHLTTSLHGASWIVRLPDDARDERLAAGWSNFEPMPGRPMRGYVILGSEAVDDPDAARGWVERAAAFVRTLPPKPAKKR